MTPCFFSSLTPFSDCKKTSQVWLGTHLSLISITDHNVFMYIQFVLIWTITLLLQWITFVLLNLANKSSSEVLGDRTDSERFKMLFNPMAYAPSPVTLFLVWHYCFSVIYFRVRMNMNMNMNMKMNCWEAGSRPAIQAPFHFM